MDTVKLNPLETSATFMNLQSLHGGRVSQLLDAYGAFQDSVALWQDDKYVIFGLAEEAIEYQMATKVVKQSFRGDELTAEALVKRNSDVEKELGDIFFFWYANCKQWGLEPLDVIRKNVEKLSDRFNRNVIKGDGDGR